MTKVLAKWTRKFHRWIAVPTALLFPLRFVILLAHNPQWSEMWQKFENLPSILMLVMSLTGAYLILLPYIVKWQRKRKAPVQKKEKGAAAA